jgi:hypothetical protein
MLDKTALSLLKSQVLLLQHQLLALWTSVTAAVVHHVKAAVAVQTVVAQEVDLVTSVVVQTAVVQEVAQEVALVTSVVVQTAVVQEVAQEMVHVQVEDQRVDPVAVQDATAKTN